MKRTTKLYITGLTGPLISIILSTLYLHLLQNHSLHTLSPSLLILPNPNQTLIILSLISLTAGILLSVLGYTEEKHQTWINQCKHALAPYEKQLFEATETQTIEKSRRQAYH